MNELILSIASGLIIGLLGSVHCVGMCGPLALSLPVHQFTRRQKWISVLLYNVGRALTYGGIGLFFGLLGTPFRIWGIQQFLSITAGLLLLLFALSKYKIKWPGKKSILPRIHILLQKALQSISSPRSFLLVGLINGALPCGLVYVAVVSSLATSNIWTAGVLMFCFGLGTMPAMISIMFFGQSLSLSGRMKLQKSMKYVVTIMACLLILRGLNLGIPGVSPKMGPDTKEIPTCHGHSTVPVFPIPK